MEENDIRTPRDRISDDFMRQMMNGESVRMRDSVSDYPNNGTSGRGNLTKDRHSWGLDEYPLAMMYAPIQKWRNAYDIETALRRGTLFKELDLPFMASNGARMGGGKCCDK